MKIRVPFSFLKILRMSSSSNSLKQTGLWILDIAIIVYFSYSEIYLLIISKFQYQPWTNQTHFLYWFSIYQFFSTCSSWLIWTSFFKPLIKMLFILLVIFIFFLQYTGIIPFSQISLLDFFILWFKLFNVIDFCFLARLVTSLESSKQMHLYKNFFHFKQYSGLLSSESF